MSEGNPRKRPEAIIRWVAMILVPGWAFLALLSLPAPFGAEDLPDTGIESVLLGLGRFAGLVLTGWLVISHLLYTLAVVIDAPRLAELLRPITLPVVRRAVAGLATVSISMGTLTAMAQTSTGPTAVTIDYDSPRQEATPTPILEPLVEVETEDCAIAVPVGSYSAPLVWLVRPGDHLWKIAGEHLQIVLERSPTQDEHARYWLEVINAARPVIRSGDPDLIYPGEEVPLPPTLNAGVRP
jgi:hypothetical protein